MTRFLIGCFFFLFCMLGCQKSTWNEKQVVRIGADAEPVSLDPRKARDLNSIAIIHMLFEGLTRTSKDGNIELALAKEVEISDDGTKYTFQLRDSYWSNGDPVESSDFAHAWKNILDPQFPSDIAYQLFVIKNGRSVKKGELPIEKLGIDTPDAKTLIVELETPVPYFFELLSMTPFFPIPSQEMKKNPKMNFECEHWISNGPYLLKEWRRSDSLFLVKNGAFWEASNTHIDEIELYQTSADTGIRMFQEGMLDWTGSPLSTISSDAIQSLREQKLLQVKPFSATGFLRVNVNDSIQGKKNPLSNIYFRKALANAIDRKSIADKILQGGQSPATSLVPLEMGLKSDGYFRDGDSKMAANFLEEALFEIGVKISELEPIVLSFMNGERSSAIAQAIQNQWKSALGIRVNLEAVESKVYFQRVSRKDFQLALGSWTADYNDPINFLEVFKYKESGTNNTGWENQRYIDLLNQSSVCMESKERMKCLASAEEVLMEQMPVIPIFHYALNYLARKELKDVSLSPIGVLDFRWAHWERE